MTHSSSDVSQPITILLNGSNYSHWAQAMRSFLKGRKLWRYITGDFQLPVQDEKEDKSKFESRLDDWDSNNHRIITWITNTSISSINMAFGRYETAKEVWDFLAARYASGDLAQKHQIITALHRMKQTPGQSVSDFHSQMSYLWDQLALSEPKWTNTKDAELYDDYRNQLRLIQFLEALSDDFEHVRATLLHRKPYPTLEAALTEILFEKTRKSISRVPSSSESVVVAAAPPKSFYQRKNYPSTQKSRTKDLFCGYCNKPGHHIDNCFKVGISKEIQCRYCKLFGHTIDKCLK